MKRVRTFSMMAAWLASCALFPSLDDLTTPRDAAGPDVAAEAEGGVDGSTSDAAPSLLSCSAANLVAYWRMDEGSGTTVHDCVQHVDGVFGGDGGGTSWGTRGDGGDLELSASGYVTLGIQSVLQVPGPVTVAGWFRTDQNPTTNYAGLYWNFNFGAHAGLEISLSTANDLYAVAGFGFDALQVNFPHPALGAWEHLAVVYEPGVRLEIYLNGISVGQQTTMPDGGPMTDAAIAPDDHEVRLGASYDTTTWRGGIDDLRVFSRALTTAEIAQLAAP